MISMAGNALYMKGKFEKGTHIVRFVHLALEPDQGGNLLSEIRTGYRNIPRFYFTRETTES